MVNISDIYADLKMQVRLSHGKWTKIVRATGCRPNTLRRIAYDPKYDPPVSEVGKIQNWFRSVNGEGTGL
jgi:hypothetical protein